MNWYKKAQERKLDHRWNVNKIKDDKFQLLFETYPISDFKLLPGGNIKEIKIYGWNFFNYVPQEARNRLPLIIKIVSRVIEAS